MSAADSGQTTHESDWDASNPALVEIIRRRIEESEQERVSFAEFMELALYHPTEGYYLGAEARAGRAGDFLTAPEAHPIYGWTLARQLVEIWQRLDRPQPFTLREYGAGGGRLALDILDGLRRIPADEVRVGVGSDLLAALRYEPVEINPARRAELTERLAAAGYAEQIGEPRPGSRITGCVLANEFVDALPVHRVARHQGRLIERYVTWRDGWFAEEPGPRSTEALAERFEHEDIDLAEGQQAEVCLGLAGWTAEVAAGLERGVALVIDYGYPAAEIYGSRFPEGTLKTYTQHTVGEDPFRAVGRQDITAHVDFTALQDAAEAAGLTTLGLTTQSDFLAGAGIGELLVALQRRPGMTTSEYAAARAAVMHLIDPGGMGRFRVLALGRGIAVEPPLNGLRGSGRR